MNEAVRTASYGTNRNSFFRQGVYEPDFIQVEPPEPSYCTECGERLAKRNKGPLCYRHHEIARRKKVERGAI